jgi:hypothetical protein
MTAFRPKIICSRIAESLPHSTPLGGTFARAVLGWFGEIIGISGIEYAGVATPSSYEVLTARNQRLNMAGGS